MGEEKMRDAVHLAKRAYRLGRFSCLVSLLLTAVLIPPASAEETLSLRVGVLNFGTVSWEMHIIEAHQLDEKRGLDLEIVPLASETALAVALQGGRVDAIVSDWLWVAHQRQAGRDYQFAPYSLSVGAVMVDPASGIDTIDDLNGRRLGIAGGPVDKTWLLLRVYAQRVAGIDLEATVEPTYAAPPMINRLMLEGDLTAAVNFWHYNARLAALGMQPLLSVESMLSELGIETVPPLLGWVFAEEWAEAQPQTLGQFLEASYEAKRVLADSDEAWESLRGMVKPENEGVFTAIRAGYQAGIPEHYGPAEIEAAEKLFSILSEEGGDLFSGDLRGLDRAIFWDGFRLP